VVENLPVLSLRFGAMAKHFFLPTNRMLILEFTLHYNHRICLCRVCKH
jgi:hypothetical protein